MVLVPSSVISAVEPVPTAGTIPLVLSSILKLRFQLRIFILRHKLKTISIKSKVVSYTWGPRSEFVNRQCDYCGSFKLIVIRSEAVCLSSGGPRIAADSRFILRQSINNSVIHKLVTSLFSSVLKAASCA